MNSRPRVFLSHSGLDHELAKSLSELIGRELGVEVFNTSESEYRFKDLKDVLLPGTNWAEEIEPYEAELREYIRTNLVSSGAYILLVTELSLRANSHWVEFEMETASAEAKKKGSSFFFPCAAEGATLRRLPEVAQEFQGTALESDEDFGRMLDAMREVLKRA